LGGPVGSGRQGMSWISLDDLIGAVMHCVQDESLAGAVNAVAPDPRSNADFGRALGRVLRRPAIAPLPAPMVSLLFGEMGRELLLRGSFVQPRRLLERGFRFEHPRLEQALAFELGKVED
jgi:NAD dependent epimerase/dehydratase family enzyme